MLEVSCRNAMCKSMGAGTAVVSVDWLVLDSMWVVPMATTDSYNVVGT
jgi:hypothetical protein